MRYKIIEGSESCHCCFCYTVVDSSQKNYERGESLKSLAECFDNEDAEIICKALNLMHSGVAVFEYHKYE